MKLVTWRSGDPGVVFLILIHTSVKLVTLLLGDVFVVEFILIHTSVKLVTSAG